MNIEDDIQRIALQEQSLQYEACNATTALDIGLRIKALIELRGKKAAIDIYLAGQQLFFYSMPGATPANADWVRRKGNTLMHFQKSSYGVSFDMKKNGFELSRYGLDGKDYAWAGGAFPVRLQGSGIVGSIAVSGLPEREDHGVIVEVLAEVLGKDINGLALD